MGFILIKPNIDSSDLDYSTAVHWKARFEVYRIQTGWNGAKVTLNN